MSSFMSVSKGSSVNSWTIVRETTLQEDPLSCIRRTSSTRGRSSQWSFLKYISDRKHALLAVVHLRPIHRQPCHPRCEEYRGSHRRCLGLWIDKVLHGIAVRERIPLVPSAF